MLARQAVSEVVAAAGTPIRAARFVAAEGVASFEAALPVAQLLAAGEPSLAVAYATAGESMFEDFENLGTFDMGAGQQLVLFMFLTSWPGPPTSSSPGAWGWRGACFNADLHRGDPPGRGAGRFGVAMVQGVYIMVGTLLIFGVNWGDPLGRRRRGDPLRPGRLGGGDALGISLPERAAGRRRGGAARHRAGGDRRSHGAHRAVPRHDAAHGPGSPRTPGPSTLSPNWCAATATCRHPAPWGCWPPSPPASWCWPPGVCTGC